MMNQPFSLGGNSQQSLPRPNLGGIQRPDLGSLPRPMLPRSVGLPRPDIQRPGVMPQQPMQAPQQMGPPAWLQGARGIASLQQKGLHANPMIQEWVSMLRNGR